MNLTYFSFFICIIVCTLIITYWAAKRSKTTSRFYTGAGSLTGFQNGLAISGDFISAASFLGIVGTIALHGFDGFLYSVGFLVSYLVVMFFIAEPVHHLGKYSLADVVVFRFNNNWIRSLMAFGTLLISFLYMIPQLVASGLLLRLLLDIDYSISVVVIGGLMTVYVVFGGMIATSWVQIVKTVVLLSGTFLLSLIVLSRFHWNPAAIMQEIVQQTPLREQFFMPGQLFDSPVELVSMQLALLLGTAGLPHILIRFFTVKNTKEVRRSLVSATWIIGTFYLITLLLGFAAIALIGYDKLVTADATGNLAAPLLAKELGGDFLFAFISAIAFTTIVAVVAGLVISATTAFSHDIYHHILKKGTASEEQQLRAARLSALGIGLLSTIFALSMGDMNVTFLVSLTFTVAASSNFPVLLLTIYWKRFNEAGAIAGMVIGMSVSLACLIFGPHIMNSDGGWIVREPLFPLYNPGIIAIPIGFLSAISASLLFQKSSCQGEEELTAFFIRAQTGMDIRRKSQ
ncbi:solute symporter family protein [Bacillus rubiinfantis]|uniref:solute symporter family protein n=1 Tax=Bacillus rubiinfantis TaxID=1499680 RepID=UPI0005A7877C|nr:cation acetate symporter [Bacillus rubiinfantis]